MLYNSIILILVAGLINGSFVIPEKFSRNIHPKRVWFFHSIIGFSIIPWMILFSTTPSNLQIYFSLNFQSWLTLCLGGIIFGLGQVCFFNAIQKIGIAKSFAVNLSMGVILGSMYVVISQGQLFSYQGSTVTISVALIIFGIIFNYVSNRAKKEKKDITGWFFIAFAGVASGIQNIVFYKLSIAHLNNDVSLFWIWPPFLLCAALPMLLYFFNVGEALNKERIKTKKTEKLINFSLISLMGVFFTGSLYFYSKGMALLTPAQKSIGWPLFMISIIIASQFWGMFFNEHKNEIKIYKLISILCLFIAIMILSIKR